MGKQHILFLILAACLVGIAFCSSVIVAQSNVKVDCRQLLQAELLHLAAEARAYRDRSFEENGGDGTFIGLTSKPFGISRLTQHLSAPFGEFFISKSGNAHSVQITAIGKSPGNDPRKPIKMLMTIFADRSAIATVN